MSQHDIAERNVERLLGVAYKPEPIDPAFALETEERLMAAARDHRRAQQAAPVDPARLLRIRRRLSWGMTAAAAMVAFLLVQYARIPAPAPRERDDQDHRAAFQRLGQKKNASVIATSINSFGLTAKPRPESVQPQAIVVGERLTTGANERRRMALPDGTVLFVNENTTLTPTAVRQVRLDQGEIYLEVAPRPGDRFTVKTADREVTAIGTHFHVAAHASGSGVLVTQGTVKVSDVAKDVTAGQQVKPGQKQPTVAPRATHVLDWLRPLVAAVDAPLVPSCKHEGGALIAVDPHGQDIQLSMRKYHIDVHIEDGFARTTIDQTYFNNTWSRLEGTFYFPLPPDASLSRLAMYVLDGKDCKLMEGGMAERNEARNAFETIRHERRDPALLEWVDGSTFKMRVFPLEAWQEKRIILSYTQRLPSLYGVARYRFPGGHNMQIVRDWSFAATVKNAKQWDILTPSHPDMKRVAASGAGQLTVSTEARLIKPEQDVVLELREREAPEGGATFAEHLQDGQRYFMTRFRPKLDTRPQRQRRDWIVLFEASANCDPLLARTQIDVFRNLLKNAEYDDTFALLAANTRVGSFDARPQAATPANVLAAVAWLERTHLVGGCDLEQALRQAVALAKDAKNPHVVHLGAGVASLGEPKDDVLARLIPDEVRYIGVGVGKKWNRSFMKMVADRTGGYFTQINPDEPVAWRAFDLLATLNTPRLLDVRVVDPNEQVTYLADAVTLAEGEEIFAFTRGAVDKFELPRKVIVSGRLDGKPYRRELEVTDRVGVVSHDAGFLPRTWAKLEIDRLLADGQDKNKAAITELSKAMYVMSPFTSLLVLESEADYKRFNIDRGRKDHWAMYPCPERIPQVYEPDPAYQRWWTHLQQPKDYQKPSEEQVLDTILMRLPPQYIFASGRQMHLPQVATARQVLLSSYAVPEEMDELMALGDLGENDWSRRARFLGRDSRARTWSLGRGSGLRDLILDFSEPESRLGLVGEAGRRLMRTRGLQPLQSREKLTRLTRLLVEEERLSERLEGLSTFEFDAFGRRSAAEFFFQPPGSMPRMLSLVPRSEAAAESASLSAARRPSVLFERLRKSEPDMPLVRFVRDMKASKPSLIANDDDAMGSLTRFSSDWGLMLTSLDGVTWPVNAKPMVADAWMQQLSGQLQSRSSASWLVYSRLQHQVDHRLFGDLTLHAPGLMASWADVQNTVAEEAKQDRPAMTGKIDDAARALFNKARQDVWHQVVYPGSGRVPGITVFASAAGQFTFRRTLLSGLQEQVVCDGQSLWHLYPEIGLGTRRPFSKFHFGELARWVPWVLPRIEDLAIGADMIAVDAKTVALVPHVRPGDRPSPPAPIPQRQRGADSDRSSNPKEPASRQLHFVFGDDGALAEVRIVELPSAKVLARQAFDAQGNIRLLDESGKQLAEQKIDRRTAEAQSVKPSLEDLVILDMPLRTGGYWDRKIEQLRNEAKAKGDESLLLPAYLGLFASSCLSRDRDSLPIFGAHFHAKGDKRIGFYTLLTAREVSFLNQPNTWAQGIATYDPIAEHPQSPLARYLAHHQKHMRVQYESDGSFLENLPGPADGFVARMAAFRNAWNAWRHYNQVNRDQAIYQREKAKLMDFIRVNTSPLFALLLQSNLNYMNTHDRAEVGKLLAETQKDIVPSVSLRYVLQYDAAQYLYYKGDRNEASRLFRELYAEVLKEGMLPKIDNVFRDCLDAADSGGPNFGAFLRGVVHDFWKKNQPHFAFLTALQASQVGNQTLGDELFQHILQRLPEDADRLTLLAALEYLAYNRLDARADAVRDRLLANPDVAASPTVWRLSAALAQRREQPNRAVADLEKALDLEYQQLPELINLEAVRRDYRELLGHYVAIAKAAKTLGQDPPKNLADRVVRAADRWRALDSEPLEVCQTAGKILKLLGAKEAAWDYATTPIALRPNEAAPWTALAVELRGEGELEAADYAYARAFVSESTNPQILWDRAQNLLQLGRPVEARRLWQQIADGTWQQRFQQLVPQARWHLEHN